jgi:hypothetical protein
MLLATVEMFLMATVNGNCYKAKNGRSRFPQAVLFNLSTFRDSRNARVPVSLLHGGRLERLGTGLKIYFELLDFEPPQGVERSACPERTKRVEG